MNKKYECVNCKETFEASSSGGIAGPACGCELLEKDECLRFDLFFMAAPAALLLIWLLISYVGAGTGRVIVLVSAAMRACYFQANKNRFAKSKTMKDRWLHS